MSRTVLVVGAAGGLGSAIVSDLFNAGYWVIGWDRVCPPNDAAFRDFVVADVRDIGQVQAACARIERGYSPLWGLVYSVGIYPIENFGNYTLELWNEVLQVNLGAVFTIIKALHSAVEIGGRIVIISSGAAHLGSRDIAYSSSKAGLLGLVRSLAITLAPSGILVNAVCPGLIETEMSSRMKPEHVKEYLERIPLRRRGAPKEVSVAVLFLLNAQNSYMTGATLDINGGLYAR